MKCFLYDFIGKTYPNSRLKILQYEHWLCECFCGKKVSIASSKLKVRLAKSCGCLKRKQGWKFKKLDKIVVNS